MKKEIALIFNPAAGRGNASRRKKKVEACLKAQNITYKLFFTKSEAHLVETAARVVHQYPVIVGAGGDTTIAIIARQILRSKKGNKLGIISLGTVNDLGREMGVLKLASACRAIKTGRSMAMDVGVLKLGNHKESFYFLCQACLGLGAALDQYYQRWAKKHSFISRFSSMTHGIVAVGLIYHSYKQKIVPVSLDLEQQGSTTPVRTPFLIFANTSIMGGRLRISPFASPFDGKLDCCILDALPFLSLLILFFRFNLQKQPESKKVEILQDKDFKIYSPHPLDIQADGKVFQTNGEIEISTLPRALNIIVDPNLNPLAPSSRDSRQL
jgi:diacylglycerol kinase family enzyme